MSKKSREKKGPKDSILLGMKIPKLLQQMQPKEFQLPPSRLEALIKALKDAQTLLTQASAVDLGSPGEVLLQKSWRPFITNLVTGLWRLRQRLVDPNTNQPLDEMRRAYKHFESVWNVLAEVGIQLRDHTGELLPAGGFPGFTVLAYQPTPGVTHERVIQTVRPTIVIRPGGLNQDFLIQRGEVIVGIPEEPAVNPSTQDHPAQ